MKAFLATLKGKIIAGALGAVVVSGGIIAAVALTGEETYRSIKVDSLSGQTVIINEENEEQDAYKGMNIKAGNAIEVKDGANMTLLMDADKYMFADEGTRFKVEASGDEAKANTKTRIVLEEGSVLCRLDSKLGDDEIFEVETPNSVMSVRGTIFKMTIYKDENGENYAKVDVLEGAVKVDLYKENGEKAGEEGLIEAGQSALVHSNTDISEFVVGESDISYDDFSGPMAEFVVNTVDDGREICIGENLFKHYTGYETHPEEEIIVKEPTATEDGQKDIYCPTCDEVVRTEVIPATGGEEPEEEPVEESVEEPVEETTEEQTEEVTPPVTQVHNHAFGVWGIVTSATCTTAGSQSHTCSVCGATETREIAATGHSYGDWKETTAATCLKAGEETRICGNCDTTETKEITAKGHSFGNWEVTTAATCEAEGVETKTCNGCGATQTRAISAIGHSYSDWDITAATCETAGSKVRTCGNCGGTESQTIAAIGHSYGSWTTTTAATCETAGVQTKTCGNCGGTETQTITATGHSYGSWTTTTAATCTTAGSESRVCGNCQKTETQTIAAKGHTIIYIHDNFSYTYTSNDFTADYIGQCSVCTDEEGYPTQVSVESHSGTYESYISPDVNNAKCNCGHEFSYSF